MGIDVRLYVEGSFSDEQITEADAFIKERFGDWDREWEPLSRVSYAPNRLSLACPDRYYGPGYERGWWPTIYNHIRLLQAAFPDGQVFYGSDVMDVGEPVTPEFLENIWDHWLGPNGQAYWLRKRH